MRMMRILPHAGRACYDRRVTPDDIRQFVDRDWAHIAAEKDRRWATAKKTAAGDLRVADQLRHHVLSIRTDWPSADDRDADLRAHIRVTEALGAVSLRSS